MLLEHPPRLFFSSPPSCHAVRPLSLIARATQLNAVMVVARAHTARAFHKETPQLGEEQGAHLAASSVTQGALAPLPPGLA